MNEKHLEKVILENGYSRFRLKQAKKNIFSRLIERWDEATDLPEDLRALLSRKIPIESIAPRRLLESAKKPRPLTAEHYASQQSNGGDCSAPGTENIFKERGKDSAKALFATTDGLFIEAVLMRHDRDRRTVCVSSQAGCLMNCSFCATGKSGFKRNLTAEEIVDQVLFFARLLNKKQERVTNVVYMGMGEPMNNYDNVMASIRSLNDKDGMNLGARHISVSTCGIVPGIKKFAKEELQVNLAISLHAADDKTRSRLMPVNAAYPIAKLMKAVAEYAAATKRKVMFEYILISGVNDSDEHARSLAALIGKNKLYHVNLIKYHETPAPLEVRTTKDKSAGVNDDLLLTGSAKAGASPVFRAPARERLDRFFDILKKSGVSCTFRVSFGEDIAGACGQLAPR